MDGFPSYIDNKGVSEQFPEQKCSPSNNRRTNAILAEISKGQKFLIPNHSMAFSMVFLKVLVS